MHPPRFLKLILLFLALPTFGQTTLHVDIGGGAAFTSLQAAVDAAASGDTILVEPGIYDEHVSIVVKDLILRSTQGPGVTAIAPTSPGTGITTQGLAFGPVGIDVTIEGFRVTADGSQPNALNSFVGGINATATNLTLRQCLVTGCQGAAGPAVAPIGGTGGINLSQGALSTGSVTVTIENCAITNNQGGSATGFFNPGEGGTGGITVNGSVACTVRHCTIANNTGGDNLGFSGGFGSGNAGPGGLFVAGGTLAVEDCVVWGNQGGSNNLGAAANEIAGAATVSNSDVQGGFAGVGNIDVDPLFTAPATGDYSPQAGSPVIDAGVCSATNPAGHDVVGNPRVRGFAPDMGAYEFLHDTTRMGTSEDILLTTVVNGNNANALLNTKNIVGGDMLVVHWESPCGSLDGGLYYLGAQFYVPGQEPMPQFPFVYLDSIGGSIIQGPIPLPAGGVDFNMTVPMGSFMPAVVRVQVLVVTPLAHHLPFAVTSDAQDLIFQ